MMSSSDEKSSTLMSMGRLPRALAVGAGVGATNLLSGELGFSLSDSKVASESTELSNLSELVGMVVKLRNTGKYASQAITLIYENL